MTDTIDATGQVIMQFIEQWESLDAEKKMISQNQRDVMNEAKSRGYEPKILRAIIRERRMEAEALAEEQILLESYKNSIGME